MAFLEYGNIKVRGISACVPKECEENAELYERKWGGYENFVATTGVERARRGPATTCTSDLCYKAAEQLVADLGWNKAEIEALVFVSQTPDYILPATSCILQERLGLPQDCYTLDVSLGCSGWVYGMSVAAGIMHGGVKKALLLVGDTTSKTTSTEDKGSWCLFGDAGTATALEWQDNSEGLKFMMNTDGSGADAIIIKDGGYRNMFCEGSLVQRNHGNDIVLSDRHCALDGMSVFSFGITKAPKSVNGLVDHFGLNKDDIDLFTFHQANLFMNEKIRKKLKIPEEKVPYSIKDFGNTSGASIPLTLVTKAREQLRTEQLKHICCGFGVGLSWGSVYFETNCIIVPELLEY